MTYLAKCEEEGVALKDVCIASRTRQLYKDVQESFASREYQISRDQNGERSSSNDGLSLCTFHSLKGLEFESSFW